MGEIADMMLDGTLCEGCGVYLEQEAPGFPGYCSEECARARGATSEQVVPVWDIEEKLNKHIKQLKLHAMRSGGNDDPYMTEKRVKKFAKKHGYDKDIVREIWQRLEEDK